MWSINAQRATNGFHALAPFSRAVGPTLLRRFTVLSLGTTVAVGVLFGAITARLVEDFALRRQARVTAAHVVELMGSRLAVQDFLLPSPARRSQVERAINDLAGRTDIVHVTVWDRTGHVLYGGGPTKPASTSTPSALYVAARDGRLQWQVLSMAGNGPGAGLPRLEVFVPVMAVGIPQPVAVYQVRSDLSDLVPALARLKWSVELSVVLGVLILYVALFTMVRTASSNLQQQESTLRHTFTGIIRSLVNALDARDMATASHSSRVADNAVMIATAMGLDDAAIHEVQVAGFLHDVGKIGIRDHLLTKRGPLTAQERAIIRQHTVFGFEILAPVPISDGIKLAVRHSHEWWDGGGYPDGLAGTQIPLSARIIAVADAYEALTTSRPYRQARIPQAAAEEIARGAGTQFDPNVVDVFLRVWQKFYQTSLEPDPEVRKPAQFSPETADRRYTEGPSVG